MQRFYGGSPTDWVEKVPGYLFWAYVNSMDQLQAEEAAASISAAVYAEGRMKEDAARAYSMELDRKLGPRARVKPDRPKSIAEARAMAGGSSIRVQSQ